MLWSRQEIIITGEVQEGFEQLSRLPSNRRRLGMPRLNKKGVVEGEAHPSGAIGMPAHVLGPPAGGGRIQQLSQSVRRRCLRGKLLGLPIPVLLVDVDGVILLYDFLCTRAQRHHCPDVVLILLLLHDTIRPLYLPSIEHCAALELI